MLNYDLTTIIILLFKENTGIVLNIKNFNYIFFQSNATFFAKYIYIYIHLCTFKGDVDTGIYCESSIYEMFTL